MTRLWVALLGALTLTPVLTAQEPAVPLPTRIGPHVIGLQLSDRWKHGSQQLGFSPFRESQLWASVDSVRE